MDLEVTRVPDFVAKRKLESLEASQSKQDGLIEFVACMADVDLPSDDGEEVGPDGS